MSGRGDFRVRAEETGWEEHGGYMQAKIRKLEDQFNQDAGTRSQTSMIFQGIAILVDGWTDPSTDELKMIMLKNGGKYHMYYSRTKTTHVIASNLPRAKRKELRPDQKVVKPQWITDSLKAKELLPVENYLVVPVEESGQSRITSLFSKANALGTGASSTSAFLKSKSISNETDSYDSSTKFNKELETSKSNTICATADSNFLSEFYSHSRLHFLSTWKMELKEYVRSLQSPESYERIPLSGFQRLLGISHFHATDDGKEFERAIMHIDMDCFFVSVGLKNHPELQGLPVAVTHSTGSGITSERPDANPEYERQYYQKKYGNSSKLNTSTSLSRTDYNPSIFGPGFSAAEIASCSYEARAVGVKNGMFMGKAKQLCPDLRVIPYDFEAYRTTSDLLYNTLASFTRHIEAVSCDEALVDISKLARETGLSPIEVASHIRAAVKEATGCNASTGVGPNIALAKMATKRAKPDGEFMVVPEEAKEFMKSLPVKDLPGVGRSTAHRLHEMGIANCGDLQNFSLTALKEGLGMKTGQKLHDMSCGIDTREVEIEKERKSVSAEVNYGIRLSDDNEAKTFFKNLSREVINRLKAIGMRGRRVTLKLMVRRSDAPQDSVKYGGHGICDSMSKTSLITLKNKGDLYEEDYAAIFECTWSIFTSMHLKVSDLRGIGIQVTQLQPVSEVKESSSALFLKKFITTKTPIITISDPQSERTDLIPSEANVRETINESFLDALPVDLRKEVEGSMREQREALERTFLQIHNENSNDSHASFVVYIDESSRGSTSSCHMFDQAQTSTSTSSSKPTRTTRKARGAKGKGSKLGSSKSTKHTRASDVSPNKLITDMFPVTYSPRKPRISPTKPSKASTGTRKPVTEHDKAKRRLGLIDVQEPETSAVVCNAQPSNHSNPQREYPTLGGAYKIENIRQALTEWISAYEAEGPLDCDVDDFISFLCQVAIEVRDLEKVHLTLRSFRRKLLSRVFETNFSNSEWRNVYTKVCDCLQKAIRDSYHGAELSILSL